jgi:chemotaxis protein methyltransferase CheR
MASALTPASFRAVTDMFHGVSGIRLAPAKHALVEGRLQKLAQQRGFDDLNAYVDQCLRTQDHADITQIIDRLTTNETYFFREPAHFELLTKIAKTAPKGTPFRVWSAASSSGEEAYSIAMILAEEMGHGDWEVLGTDLSTDVVARARQGLYPMDRARDTPPTLLKKHCLKGQGPYAGQLLVSRELRARTKFMCANLTQALPDIGQFDVIFLRNVLIYFDNPGKEGIVRNVSPHLKKSGLLFTGHAESLGNLKVPVRTTGPAVYAPSS